MVSDLIKICWFWLIMKEDDNNWAEPDRVGQQEVEIVIGMSISLSLLQRSGPSLMFRAVRIPRVFWFR